MASAHQCLIIARLNSPRSLPAEQRTTQSLIWEDRAPSPVTPSHLLHFITFGFISLHLKAQSITLAFSGCPVLIANVALPWHFTFPAGDRSERLKGHRKHRCHPQATSLKHQQPVQFNKHGRKAGVQPQTKNSVWILLMWSSLQLSAVVDYGGLMICLLC